MCKRHVFNHSNSINLLWILAWYAVYLKMHPFCFCMRCLWSASLLFEMTSIEVNVVCLQNRLISNFFFEIKKGYINRQSAFPLESIVLILATKFVSTKNAIIAIVHCLYCLCVFLVGMLIVFFSRLFKVPFVENGIRFNWEGEWRQAKPGINKHYYRRKISAFVGTKEN